VVRRQCCGLWGFSQGWAVCDLYPARIGAQLKRYGTNIAKWGFNVCDLHDFNDLRHGKNGKKSAFNNFRVISFTTSFGQQHIADR
jgi:hypothetical protein